MNQTFPLATTPRRIMRCNMRAHPSCPAPVFHGGTSSGRLRAPVSFRGAALVSGLSRDEGSAERGEFLGGVPLHQVPAAVDEVQIQAGVALERERGALRRVTAILPSVDQPQR